MNPVVVFQTSLGAFEVELYADRSPLTVKNFLDYVAESYYDQTIFHRVISNFMIQGGGFTVNGQQKATRAAIRNESGNGVKNIRYAIAMARTSDLHSATSQFFINVKDNDFLDQNQYCAFGKVVAGTEVIEKIKAVRTGSHGPHQDWPLQNVVIQSARLKAPPQQ